MAVIDYGAIAFKNGVLISTDMFTPMEETCGFSDPEYDGNDFVVIGNKDILFGFYKTHMHWKRKKCDYEPSGCEFFGMTDYHRWKSWNKFFFTGTEVVSVTVKPRFGYYEAKLSFGDADYKVYFGYGVDLRFYEKTRRANYYRSPEYFFKILKYKLKCLLKRFSKAVYNEGD